MKLGLGLDFAPNNAASAFDYTADYFTQGISTIGWIGGTPNAQYDPSTNRTYVSNSEYSTPQAGGNMQLIAKTRYYDHATKLWSAAYDAVPQMPLVDDDHGTPSLVVLGDGRIAAFAGAHSALNPLSWSITSNPNDLSSWVHQPTINSTYTYPVPLAYGGGIQLLCRVENSDNMPCTILPLAVSGSMGSFSFANQKVLWTYGSDSRCYQGQLARSGNKLYIPGAFRTIITITVVKFICIATTLTLKRSQTSTVAMS